jgi:hypothetical protein
MSDISVKVKKRKKKAITFDLEGDPRQYKFVAGKQALMVLPMLDAENDLEAAKAAFSWLDDGLSEEDRKHLSDRLRDPEDDLDNDAINDLVEAIVEQVSGGRPTT